MAKFDVLTTTASQLQGKLTNNQITSVEIVQTYLARIQRHNKHGMKFNSIICTAPEKELLARAQFLDDERKLGNAKGKPLFGIPVSLKDVILTPSLNMGTTLGSYAFDGATARFDAGVVDKLQAAGLIVFAKDNMSELGGAKGWEITAGWSAKGGQTQSPYVRGGVLPEATFLGHSSPCGSASGSAVGVAAGFTPFSVATEMDGSIVQPATRAALYSIKTTVGKIDRIGIEGGAPSFDSVDVMAKSAKDVADLLGVLTVEDYSKYSSGSWEDIRIGFVDPDLWQPVGFVVEPNEEFRKQTYDAMDAAKVKIRALGAKFVENVPLISLAEAVEDSGLESIDQLFGQEFRPNFEHFLSLFDNPNKPNGIKSIEDLRDFNIQSAHLELLSEHPNQEVLDNMDLPTLTKEQFQTSLDIIRTVARQGIDKPIQDGGIDLILGPADGRMATVAAAAGYPIGTVPLGFSDSNGRAFGMNVIASAYQEGEIIQLMSAWEKTFAEARVPPPQRVNWDKLNDI